MLNLKPQSLNPSPEVVTLKAEKESASSEEGIP